MDEISEPYYLKNVTHKCVPDHNPRPWTPHDKLLAHHKVEGEWKEMHGVARSHLNILLTLDKTCPNTRALEGRHINYEEGGRTHTMRVEMETAMTK